MKPVNLSGCTEHPLLRRLFQFVTPYRFPVNVLIHCILFMISYAYSILLLNGLMLDGTSVLIFVSTVGPLLLFRILLFYSHDLFQGMWRYVSFEDLINILRATIISSLLFYFLGMVWDRFCVAEELYILDLTFCILLTGGVRSLVRNVRERYFRGLMKTDQKRVIVLGPLDKVQPIIKEFTGDPMSEHVPVAVVDPDKNRHADTTRLCDVPVLSIEQLLKRKKHFSGVDAIVFCYPGSTRKEMDQLVDRLKTLSVPFKTIPHIEDILQGRVSISDIREVEIEDLLDRPAVQIEMGKISSYLENKTIMVTGGGGSIGSEICRQVSKFKPARLVVVERSENNLYDLIMEFNRSFPNTPLSAVVSTVNDFDGIKGLMQEFSVDVVFHAAAYKHVPLMESTPIESAYNNIEGTYNTARAALAAGVKRFVMISTDKAVNPTNVMGVTKRIAEMIVQSMAGADTRYMTVRFGNVLGSAGSVIPVFKNQIKTGGPLTVTHPDIERFFMTIPEAVQLVLQAGCMGKGGEIFVLDMGKPVKILKLAENLITLSGKVPYTDIDIVFTGLRPGEKMFEELFNGNENLLATTHPRIRAADSVMVPGEYMDAQLKIIRQFVRSKNAEALLLKFQELVPGYHCPETADSSLAACNRAHSNTVKRERDRQGIGMLSPFPTVIK